MIKVLILYTLKVSGRKKKIKRVSVIQLITHHSAPYRSQNRKLQHREAATVYSLAVVRSV